jgi:hypothetical protein
MEDIPSATCCDVLQSAITKWRTHAVQSICELVLTEETEILEKKSYPSDTFSSTNLTWTGLRFEPNKLG